jgi:riboflavin synthase
VLRVETPADLRSLVAEKGSIAVDGVSLTVSTLGGRWFEAAIIPHTLAATTLGDRRAGDAVNLEVDLLARHVARLMETGGAGERGVASGFSGRARTVSPPSRRVRSSRGRP